MSMTLLANSLITVSLIASRNCGSVFSWSLGTSFSSPPACKKLARRKSLSSVLLLRGFVRLLKAASISSRDLMAGLGDR